MNVLMLSTDDRVFEEGSEVRERMRRLGTIFTSLHIAVFTTHGGRREEKVSGSDNVFLYPTVPTEIPFKIWIPLQMTGGIIERIGRVDVITAQDGLTFEVARPLMWRYRIPTQLQIHTDFLSPAFREEHPLRYTFYSWAVESADCIRVVSERIKRSIVEIFHIQEGKISVLPVFVDVERILGYVPKENLRARYPNASPLVLVVARLAREKNVSLAVDVFAEFKKDYPGALLLIVGDGPERERLKVKVKSSKLDDSVHFEGWQQDVLAYYRAADVLLVTSAYEGYGRMFIEAAASGVPIATTPVGIAGELLREDEHLLTFGTQREGVAALERLVTDHAFAALLKERAREAVRALPDLPAYLRAYRDSFGACGGLRV